ncbi:MAG: site-specific integrase, partial [Lentisphaeria bacterium]
MPGKKTSEPGLDLTAARSALAQDKAIQLFLRYLRNERQYSENTMKSYFLDAAHFIYFNPNLPQAPDS